MWRWLLVCLAPPLTMVAVAQPELDRSRQLSLEQAVRENQDRLGRRQQELVDLEAALGETSGLLDARIAARDRIAQELAQLRIARDRLSREIAELEGERDLTLESIAGLEHNLEILKVRIQTLLVNLHRQRARRFGQILAQVSSLHELQVRNHYLSLLTEQDVEVVNQLDATLRQLTEAQVELDRQILDLEGKNAELATTEVQLIATEEDLNTIIAALETTREGQLAQRQALLEAQNDLEERLADLNRQLQEEITRLVTLENELRRQAAQARLDNLERERLTSEADRIQGLIDNLTAPSPNTLGFVMPISGGRIVASYGENNNSFVALQAPAPNAAVWSAGAGVVADASFIGVNDGHMVIIRHSPTFFTVYANLREPEVRVGQRIEQGQRLGFLGGSSLQPNDLLKLFVRIEGERGGAFVDPVAELGLTSP